MNQLHSPLALLLLIVLPLMVWFVLRKKRTAAIKFSSLLHISKIDKSWRVKLRPILLFLRIICLLLLIVAIARPRHGSKKTIISTEGIAIQLVVDCSGSMAEEIEYAGKNVKKLDAVKNVVKEFVKGDGDKLKGRTADLIGLVTYATYPETICPLVHSHNILLDYLENTQPIEHRQLGNTAIGDAIALASARLHQAEIEVNKQSKYKKDIEQNSKTEELEDNFKIKSKIIILLTDGKQNTGEYSQQQAAELAKKWGIKIYTIAFASDVYRQSFFGRQKVPVSMQVDERALNSVAKTTDGQYFRAENIDSLKEIYKIIDDLEKSKVESMQYSQYAERFSVFAKIALILLVLEMLTSTLIFRKIP